MVGAFCIEEESLTSGQEK